MHVGERRGNRTAVTGDLSHVPLLIVLRARGQRVKSQQNGCTYVPCTCVLVILVQLGLLCR